MATCDLFHKILDASSAHKDQDYPRVVIDCNTSITDRTEAILHGGADPVPEMVKSAVKLQGMGADVLVMPCNTAHFFYDRVTSFIDIPLINMLEETAKQIQENGYRKVGLLATDGTIQSQVYKRVFDKYGIEMIIPDKEGQRSVMDIIYNGVKSNNYEIDTQEFKRTIDHMLAEGAETLVLGCTELPIAFEKFGFMEKNLDPTMILAESAVHYVKKTYHYEESYYG